MGIRRRRHGGYGAAVQMTGSYLARRRRTKDTDQPFFLPPRRTIASGGRAGLTLCDLAPESRGFLVGELDLEVFVGQRRFQRREVL